jgi:hypothetical protein
MVQLFADAVWQDFPTSCRHFVLDWLFRWSLPPEKQPAEQPTSLSPDLFKSFPLT